MSQDYSTLPLSRQRSSAMQDARSYLMNRNVECTTYKGELVLSGGRDKRTRMWKLPIKSVSKTNRIEGLDLHIPGQRRQGTTRTNTANNLYTLPYKHQQLKYMHQSFFSPPSQTIVRCVLMISKTRGTPQPSTSPTIKQQHQSKRSLKRKAASGSLQSQTIIASTQRRGQYRPSRTTLSVDYHQRTNTGPCNFGTT